LHPSSRTTSPSREASNHARYHLSQWFYRSLLVVAASLLALLLPGTLLAGTTPQERVIYVDADARAGGKGTPQRPYSDVFEALDYARVVVSAGDTARMILAPGTYSLRRTLSIDIPLTLEGGSQTVNDADGWPLAQVAEGTDTKLTAASCEVIGGVAQPVISINATDGQTISNVAVSSLIVQGSGSACPVVQVRRAQNFRVEDVVVRGPSLTGIDVTESSGAIVHNHVSGAQACGICVSSGTESNPAEVVVRDNRSTSNIGGGVLLGGTTFPLLDIGNGLTAEVFHNDLSLNTSPALGFGIRVIAIGSQSAEPAVVPGRVTATILGNRLHGNRNSIMIDAGFPQRVAAPGQCDQRMFTGEFELALDGNTVSGSVSKAVLVSFTRGQIYTGTNPHGAWQYLHDANYNISDPDETLQLLAATTPTSNTEKPATAVVLDHPENDRVIGGVCTQDQLAEPLNNVLMYNGSVIPPTPN
jgi:hypothetical protein